MMMTSALAWYVIFAITSKFINEKCPRNSNQICRDYENEIGHGCDIVNL